MRLSRSPALTVLAVACWVVVFGPSLAEHMRNSANPLIFNDDVRQQVWPFFRYFDGGFANDYIGQYYLDAFYPVGYRAVFTALAHVVDPAKTSKVIPYLLLALTVGLCALAARRLEGNAAFLGCGLLCLSADILLERMVGGLPRSFGFPIMALAMYALVAGKPWGVAAAVVLGALFYPTAAVAPGAALALWLFALPRGDRLRAERWSIVRRCVFLAGIAVLAAALVVPNVVSARRYGGFVKSRSPTAPPFPEIARRYAFQDRSSKASFAPVTIDALTATLIGKGAPFVPALSVRAKPGAPYVMYGLGLAALLGLLVSCRRDQAARRLLCLVAATCAAFVAAMWLRPYLYLPQRHLFCVVPLVTVVLLPTSAAAFGKLLGNRLSRHAAPALALFTAFGVLLALGGGVAPRTGLYIQMRADRGIYPFLAKLPQSAMVAGLPDNLMDNVPYLSRRPVLLTHETYQVVHIGYVAEMRRRMGAVIAATYATNTTPIVRLRDEFHVTHLVVDRAHLAKAPFKFFPPFDVTLRAAYARCARRKCVLANGLRAAEVFRQGGVVVFDLSKLPLADGRPLPAAARDPANAVHG